MIYKAPVRLQILMADEPGFFNIVSKKVDN